MPSSNDLKKGTLILVDGDPYTVIDISVQTPSARGGATLIKTKIRNLKNGQLLNKTYKGGERIDEPNIELVPVQYLYKDNDDCYNFMNTESYEQYAVQADAIAYEMQFLRENDEARIRLFDGQPISLEVPNTVLLEVVECAPAIRGDTVTNTTKSATLETGLEVQVPLFVEVGNKLWIDTRDARYLKRG